MNPPAAERVLVLDRDASTHETLAECANTLTIAVQPCDLDADLEALRGQRHLLAFVGYPNDPIFKDEGLLNGSSRLVLVVPAAQKKKAIEQLGGGVFGILTKPFQPEEADALIRRALEIQRFQRELGKLRSLEHLAEAMMDRIRLMAKKADPARKGDLFEFVMKCIEKPLLQMVLEETHGNRLKAANILGINRNTLRAKLNDLGINQRR